MNELINSAQKLGFSECKCKMQEIISKHLRTIPIQVLFELWAIKYEDSSLEILK